jgi:ABC-2 type transport system ATP-binding protein
MSTFAIFAKGLVKQFKTRKSPVTAVDHLDLEVRPGETYGLIGPDGAGKTTTIRVVLGLLTRTEGESSILGLDSMHDTYAIRERIGYIAQQFVLPADLTVMENMLFFAKIQGVEPDEQKKRIPELLDFAGLTDFTNRLAGQLSGGMKKKLALACSLIHEPRAGSGTTKSAGSRFAWKRRSSA